MITVTLWIQEQYVRSTLVNNWGEKYDYYITSSIENVTNCGQCFYYVRSDPSIGEKSDDAIARSRSMDTAIRIFI
jgi:hypothetical protein